MKQKALNLSVFICIIFLFLGTSIAQLPINLSNNHDAAEKLYIVKSESDFKSIDEFSCPENSIYGQAPENPWAVIVSNTNEQRTAQQFSDITLPIGGIVVYAVFYDGAGTPCLLESYNIELIFYTNENDLPGAEVLVVEQESVGEDTGEIFIGTYPIYTFTIMLDEPISLSDGWFSFSNSDEVCWLSILGGDNGTGEVVINPTGSWEPWLAPVHANFCLLPEYSAPDTPGYPTNLIASADEDGDLEAVVEWTNPETTSLGDPLTDLDFVYLYVNGELETTISSPVIGANESVNYSAATNGIYSFEVFGSNDGGDGLASIANEYIGFDVPGAPTNFIAVNQDENGYLSWEAPVVGLNGGYFDGDITTYTILRSPDGVELTTSGSDINFLDETVLGPGFYWYKITAFNNNGEGGSAETEGLYLGGGVPRTIVIGEEGTGTWCSACPPAALAFDELLANDWPVGLIAYHFGDDYQTIESLARTEYYNIIGYPTTIFDGVSVVIGGGSGLYETYVEIVEERLATPTAVTIDIENVTFDGTTFNADIVTEAIATVIYENTVMHAVLTESHIPESWQGGLDEINEVERSMFNGSTGTPIDLINNTTVTIPIEFTIDATWEASNCELVVFIQENESREILNGNKFSFTTVGTHAYDNMSYNFYPNPSTDKVYIETNVNTEKVQLINFAGQVILEQSTSGNKTEINTSKFDSGIYFIKIFSQDNIITRKLVIE